MIKDFLDAVDRKFSRIEEMVWDRNSEDAPIAEMFINQEQNDRNFSLIEEHINSLHKKVKSQEDVSKRLEYYIIGLSVLVIIGYFAK
jgi:hypothetical protein